MKETPGKSKREVLEYKFIPRSQQEPHVPNIRFSLVIFLGAFQLAFIILYGFYVGYDTNPKDVSADIDRNYSIFIDVHTIVFVGFGFFMAFLKRYGYGSVGFNLLIGAYVIEWALLVRGWFDASLAGSFGRFNINVSDLLAADFCAIAVLISLGVIVGKASLSQLVVMATIEVVIQALNQYICVNYFHSYDVGRSIYVHVFGAYFGLAVAKMLCVSVDGENTRGGRIAETSDTENLTEKDQNSYNSDLFALLGTLFMWMYWPSYNAAWAEDEGRTRAIVNTYLSVSASCIVAFLVSVVAGKGRLRMTHIRNATVAGGVAVGAVADMAIQPAGALIIGTLAGIIAALGAHYVTPRLNRKFVHDTCGIHNLHGMPGILAALASVVVAGMASLPSYGESNRMYKFFPSRVPVFNSTLYINESLAGTEFDRGGLGRSGAQQAGYQIVALVVTLMMALLSGTLTGLFMRLPIFEQLRDQDELFEDDNFWSLPLDTPFRTTTVDTRSAQRTEEEEEMEIVTTKTTKI